MSEQAGPYTIMAEHDESDGYFVIQPNGLRIGVPPTHYVVAKQRCDDLNRGFAAGAASTQRPAGEAQPPSGTGGQAVQAVIDAARKALVHVEELREAWRRGAISEHDGRGGTRSNRNVDVEVALRAALASLSTGGDADGGK